MQIQKIIDNKLFYLFLLLVFFVAVFFRIMVLLDNRPFWHDEAPVALTVINNSFLDMYNNIVDFQKAPFLFWAFSKLTTNILGISELSFRLYPFICSIISIFIFYSFSCQFLEKKSTIIIANFLFAINFQLLYFAQELKQYSSDILFFMLSLLFFSRIINYEFNFKKALIVIVYSFLMILLSFPSCFVVAAFLILKIFKLKKTEIFNMIFFILSLLVFGSIYYFVFLFDKYNHELNYLADYWQSGFLSINNFYSIFESLYLYFFKPNISFFMYIPLFLYGFYLISKEKRTIFPIVLVSLLIVILSSVLAFYPLFERVAVYLIPLFIVFSIKPFDVIKGKCLKNILIIGFSLLSFSAYFDGNYYERILSKEPFLQWDAKESLLFIKDNYKEKDVILINESSYREYQYYSRAINFHPEEIYRFSYRYKTKEEFYNYINNLDLNKKYWFYLPFVGSDNQEQKWLKDWRNKNLNKVVKEYKKQKSYVIKISK